MKKLLVIAVSGICLNLVGCSKVPSECNELWDKMEKIAKQSGIPEDALKKQKIEFEDQISKIPRQEAVKSCKTQAAVFELLK